MAFDFCLDSNINSYPLGYKILGYYEVKPEGVLNDKDLLFIKSGKVYKGGVEMKYEECDMLSCYK